MQPKAKDAAPKKQENLIEAEEKFTGSVSFRDYRNFLGYSMGLCGFFFFIFVASLAATSQLAVSLFLANWSAQSLEEQQRSYYPQTMGLLIGIAFLTSLAREFVSFNMVIRSTSNMHRAMANRIVRAKIVFFDSNPIGRILTRFSKDMAALDLILPPSTTLATYGFFRTLSVVVALSIVNVWLLVPLVFVVAYFGYIVRRSARPMVEA